MAKPNARIWTCACGRQHIVDGKPINCIGPGHSVTIMPAFFTYDPKGETPKPQSTAQYGLF